MPYFTNLYTTSPQELPTRARTVYFYLRDRAGSKGQCWPAVNTIAKDLGMSRSTVKRAIHDLTAAGMVGKERRYRDNGSNSSNLLTLQN